MVKWTKTYALVATLALGVLGCFLTRTAAQQEGKMTGTIIDFDGNPWANLPVKIKSDVGAISESKTDAAGKFSFSGLKKRQIYVYGTTSADAGSIRCRG